MFSRAVTIRSALLCALMVCLAASATRADSKTSAEAMRVLQRDCLGCHNPEKHRGGLNLTTREAALKGGEDGPVIAPKKESKLITVLAAEADPHMPPKKQLKSADIDLLKKWIASGAQWNAAALAKASQPREVKLGPIPETLRAVYAIALTPDGSHLAIGRGTNIQIFDLTSTNSAPQSEWSAHSEIVRALAWSADGKKLASGSFREV